MRRQCQESSNDMNVRKLSLQLGHLAAICSHESDPAAEEYLVFPRRELRPLVLPPGWSRMATLLRAILHGRVPNIAKRSKHDHHDFKRQNADPNWDCMLLHYVTWCKSNCLKFSERAIIVQEEGLDAFTTFLGHTQSYHTMWYRVVQYIFLSILVK